MIRFPEQLVWNGESPAQAPGPRSRDSNGAIDVSIVQISNWPPVVAISCLNADSGRLKDTTNNVKNSKGGFVISIISEPFVELANAASIDAPPEVDEWSFSGLTKLPSVCMLASFRSVWSNVRMGRFT